MRNSSLFFIAAAKRKERGISLDQIASQTKIGTRLLQAIEEGDFGKLPGGIYNTSYIRQYARAIDVDEVELIAVYQAASSSGVNPTTEAGTGVRAFLPALQG